MGNVAEVQRSLVTDVGPLAAASLSNLVKAFATKRVSVPLTSLMETDGTNTVAFLGPATTPVLDLANGDTDGALDVVWASSNSDAVVFQVAIPDIDANEDLKIFLRVKGGATDTETIASDVYFNEGDTKVEDVSAAVSAAVQELSITVAASDIPAGAKTFSCELTPGAHTNDALTLTAVWIQYTQVLKI